MDPHPLQLSQDGLSARLVDALAVLLLSIDDLAVVHDNGIASGALAHRPADGLAETVVVGKDDEVVPDVVGLGPGGHDKGVVVGDDDDLVHALGLEGLAVVDVRGEVGRLAGGGEGSGDGHEDDLFVPELLYGGPKLAFLPRTGDQRRWDGIPALAS